VEEQSVENVRNVGDATKSDVGSSATSGLHMLVSRMGKKPWEVFGTRAKQVTIRTYSEEEAKLTRG
jgi:hypothetical protein